MKQIMAAALAVGGLAWATAGSATAQVYTPPATSPFPRPILSPYLNMARGGNPAVNYYGLVRPEFATNQSLLQLQQQQALLGQNLLTAEQAAATGMTGHPSQFMNFGHYYNGRVANYGTLSPLMTPPVRMPLATVPLAAGGGAMGGLGTFGGGAFPGGMGLQGGAGVGLAMPIR